MDPSTHLFPVVFSSSRLTLSSALPEQLLKKPFDILKQLGRSRSCNASVIPFFDKRPVARWYDHLSIFSCMQFRNFHLGKVSSPVGENSQTTRPKFLWATTWFVVADRLLPIGIFPRQLENLQPASEWDSAPIAFAYSLALPLLLQLHHKYCTSICTFPNYGKCLPIYVHRDRWIDTSVMRMSQRVRANESENATGKRTNETRVRQVRCL